MKKVYRVIPCWGKPDCNDDAIYFDGEVETPQDMFADFAGKHCKVTVETMEMEPKPMEHSVKELCLVGT